MARAAAVGNGLLRVAVPVGGFVHVMTYQPASGGWADDAVSDWGAARPRANTVSGLAWLPGPGSGRWYLYYKSTVDNLAWVNMERYVPSEGRRRWAYAARFYSDFASIEEHLVAGAPIRGLSAVAWGTRVWMAQDAAPVNTPTCPTNLVNERVMYFPFAHGTEERPYADFDDWSFIRDNMVGTNTTSCVN